MGFWVGHRRLYIVLEILGTFSPPLLFRFSVFRHVCGLFAFVREAWTQTAQNFDLQSTHHSRSRLKFLIHFESLPSNITTMRNWNNHCDPLIFVFYIWLSM